MSITLTPAPDYDQFSTGHYSEDNARIDQLNFNDAVLAAQLNALGTASTGTYTGTGNWASLTFPVTFPAAANNSGVAASVKIWGIEDTGVLAAQNSFIAEVVVMGYTDSSGNYFISGQSLVYCKNIGTKTVGIIFSIVGNQIVGSFSGFTGTSGKIQVKLDFFN